MLRYVRYAAAAALTLASLGAHDVQQPVNDAPNPYTTIRDFFRMPEGRTWGSTSAVEIDRDGKSVWIAERCGANSCFDRATGKMSDLPSVLKFDSTGKLVASFAGILVFPHGIYIDREVTDGQDNAPAAPPGTAPIAPAGPRPGATIGNQVFKFSPEGKVDAVNVVGGPSWLELDRFDIAANAPAGTSQDALKSMLQALLADRFRLAVHNGNGTLSAYGLTLGKRNPQVKAADGTGAKGCKSQPPDSPTLNVSFSCHNLTMAEFVRAIPDIGVIIGYVGRVPLVDQTGLQGAWDFTLKFSSLTMVANTDGADSLFDAIDKQMGMKLELKKVTAPVLFVDSVNRTPTPNAADVTQKLPAV